jgi:GT2 family glycosyltransferase
MNEGNTLPLITVVIPTRNNAIDLIDCINSLMSLDYDLKNISIIIWDNDSDKKIKERIKDFLNGLRHEKGVDIRLIENDVNLGGFTSRAELFGRIPPASEYVLSLDDDVILPKNLLKDSLRHFSQGKSVGIAGPRIVYDDAPDETAHGDGFINRWFGLYRTGDPDVPVECDYIIGCCMLIGKEVIDEIGGFDRDYFTSHGEVDFCLRAKKEGFKVIYDPIVSVRHRIDRGGTRTLERIYYVYRNKLLVIKRNFPIPQKWIALLIHYFLGFPKAIIDSILINKKVNLGEMKIISKAMYDGWMNRFGKRM